MANKFTRYLTDFANGFLAPKGTPSNFRHATRLYIDDTYRLSPRTKFLYYVKFEIDKTVVKATNFANRHADEVGLLIKNAELPKYNFDSVIKNQYNRKKIIYKNFNYDPVNLVFHDDSQGIMNALWALYYGYYIQDRTNSEYAFAANQYRDSESTLSHRFRYGLDSDITAPFFKNISIYTMSKRRFLGYTLINPKIKSWTHGNMDYSVSETNENSMTVEYESVAYSSGNVSRNSPKGFATLHYDNLSSPLGVFGGGFGRVFGDGGIVDGIEQVFGAVSDGSAFENPANFFGTVANAVNTARAIGSIRSSDLRREAVSIITSPTTITGATTSVNNALGAAFFKNRPTVGETNATPKNIIPPQN
jgi:hypothetical protein